jgi:hypothetical protein
MTGPADRSLSRRQFLQTATGALASTAAASTRPSPASAQVPNVKLPEPPGRQVGFALVGLGNLAINQRL